jgi:hypothetical protein
MPASPCQGKGVEKRRNDHRRQLRWSQDAGGSMIPYGMLATRILTERANAGKMALSISHRARAFGSPAFNICFQFLGSLISLVTANP